LAASAAAKTKALIHGARGAAPASIARPNAGPPSAPASAAAARTPPNASKRAPSERKTIRLHA
jgi:hypothetical protein